MKLNQTNTQQQRILPTQIQYLNFLKLQQHELQQTIREEIEENIFLEEDIKNDEEPTGDELDAELTYDDADTYEDEYSFKETGVNDSKLHNEKRDVMNNTEGLVYAREQLLEEIRTLNVTPEEFEIAEYVIHSLDSDGYLRVTADDIADSLSFAWQRMVDMETVQRVIEMVQNTGPAGIAAHNLQECMLLQLFRKEKKNKYDAIAYGIVEDDFNLLCERNFSTICQKHEINDEDIKMVLKTLKRLHASPCNLEDAVNQKARKEDSGIDFVINEDENGKLQGELVESFIGAVKINTVTAETLKALSQKKKKTKSESSQETFLKNKAQAAKWFLDCISQREHSMKLVIDSIITLQEKYLRSGNKQDLVPMVLQDIADRTNLDVSTVSRITSARYAETAHGKLALKDLFTFGIQGANGNLISNINVKEMLLAIINEEDKSNPYTDDQIAKILAGRGIKIARRTVLKYRDEFGLPAAKYRSRKAA